MPEIEEKVLAFWEEKGIFKKVLKSRRKGRQFTFYEGPPYANGHPGLHHALARIFKDIVLRYKTMEGFYVPRQGGWDTHGLPIELATEKELGIKTKDEIERYGVAKFNAKAKEIVTRYRGEFEDFTKRIGYWLDLENAYFTYKSSYIESLWWVFKTISDRGYLKESKKVVPYCPRCGTPLSSHELGQPDVYRLTKDRSVYVKFKLLPGQKIGKDFVTDDKTCILSWTTTPWTLPGNVALAVGEKIDYEIDKAVGGEHFILASLLKTKVFSSVESEDFKEKIAVVRGRDLIGLKYEPLFDIPALKSDKSYKVYAADFVTTDEGTGVVHTAVMYGEDDYKLGVKIGLPEHHTVTDTALFTQDVKGLAGLSIKDKETEEKIFDYLKSKNFLFKTELYEHEYPFCWRCSTPLIYFARTGWFFEVSRLREKLVSANETINWIPAYLKEGRFGEWIKEAKDWSISRERYWGTPLPIWRCPNGHLKVIGSLKDLGGDSFYKNNFFLLRHGEAEHNLKDVIAAGPETGKRVSRLTPKGIKQAEKAARDLAAKKIEVVFSSPYRRTMETAEILAGQTGAEIHKDERLGEINAGVYNWRPVAEFKAFHAEPMSEFTKRAEGGENLDDVRERMVDFISEINKRFRGKNILIVSHGDPSWMLEAVMRHVSDEEAMKLDYPDVGAWKKIKLDNLPMGARGEIDPHRPYVDEVFLKCGTCGGEMKRVPDVADVWFDSGAMPFASIHYPFENKSYLEKSGYPADFISEGIDQTRGWFYTLLAVSVLLGRKAPYRNVISLGLIHDKYGRKMSKSKGNVLDPQELIKKYGIDVIRWYFYTVKAPAEPKNFDEEDLGRVLRRFFLTFYNCFVFYRMIDFKPGKKPRVFHALDRWIIARLNETIALTTGLLQKYEIGPAAREIESLIDDLSRWYIRRSRDRSEIKPTLELVLREASKLAAPFAPFWSEALYRSLPKNEFVSVHEENWPKADKKLIDKNLLSAMAEVRRLAALALALRNEAGIKVRQPLAALKLKTASRFLKDKELAEILKEEVNVKEIVFDKDLKEEAALDLKITPALREEGIFRELTRTIQGLRQSAGLTPKETIGLAIETDGLVREVIQKKEAELKKAVRAKEIILHRTDKFKAESATKIEETPVWLGLRKI